MTPAANLDWCLVKAWLLDEFAYLVPLPGDLSTQYLSQRKTFYADRYGDDGLTPHGGSGRVGISGGFQVKGIGPTPLVGRHADWLHNHGCMWLEEAVRESLVSELIHREFPVGSVPVIAIIDTGVDASFTLQSPDRRRALVIRPSFYRPAHMQRAPMFTPVGGDRLSAQFADARRTRQMTELLGQIGSLHHFADNCALQAGHAFYHRCFLGGMLSSNWAMDGRICDFGGITNVDDWSPMEVSPGLPRFGSETIQVELALESVCARIGTLHGDFDAPAFLAIRRKFRELLLATIEGISAASGPSALGFSLSADGLLSVRGDQALQRRFRFNRQNVQKMIWNATVDPDSLEDGSVGSLIDSLMEELLMG